MTMSDEDDVFERFGRRAMESAAGETPWEEPDIFAGLRPDDALPADIVPADATPPDLTLRGYIERHDRPPAFEGADGQPYTVAVDTAEEAGDAARPFVAFLVFVRWAETGAGIMGHVESGDVARGATADAAQQAALDLSLYDVKTELDAAIERRRRALEE
jgi:hypothetical protein